jgi:hypothetical protein
MNPVHVFYLRGTLTIVLPLEKNSRAVQTEEQLCERAFGN